MSGRAPYSRVYWSIVDDPRFAAVYDHDGALATWLRLLLIADQAHPASAHLPIGVKVSAVAVLEQAGLVEVSGSRYRIHGLDAERERRARRSHQEPNSAPVGEEQVPNRSPVGDQSVPRARGRLVSSRLDGSSSSSGGGPGEGMPNVDSTVARVWEEATGRSVISSGNFAIVYLDDVCIRHPVYEVCAAILRARKQFDHVPATQPMVAAMRPILDPFPDAKATAKAEREREAAAASRRGTAATLRRNHELGGHRDEPHGACPACQEVTA